jgi:hypothetical protein
MEKDIEIKKIVDDMLEGVEATEEMRNDLIATLDGQFMATAVAEALIEELDKAELLETKMMIVAIKMM